MVQSHHVVGCQSGTLASVIGSYELLKGVLLESHVEVVSFLHGRLRRVLRVFVKQREVSFVEVDSRHVNLVELLSNRLRRSLSYYSFRPLLSHQTVLLPVVVS